MSKKAIIFGGSRGLGFAILKQIKNDYDLVIDADIVEPLEHLDNVTFRKCDLSKSYFECPFDFSDVNTLIVTAGLGVVKEFKDISSTEINKLMNINSGSVIKIIKAFYPRLLLKEDVKCFIMGSITGEVVSPLFSVYSAAKSSITMLCEALNVELEMSGSNNRITVGCAVSFKGTSFSGGETDLQLIKDISSLFVEAMNKKETKVYLNKELCMDIKTRYFNNPTEFGKSSYKYKIDNNRVSNRKITTIGYLSGTFDLFHVGHLNILKRAKEQCDYLVVGVHKSGAWKGKETFIPFEERVEILKSIKYVDEVHESTPEDSDAWDLYHYDKLFVGDDYKGSERFKKYEQFFQDKGVEIVYFPYTKGTSSTQIRDKIKKAK